MVLKELQVWFTTLFKKRKKVLAEIWLFLTNLPVTKKHKKQKKTLQKISFIVFWEFSKFYWIFISPQVKGGVIITYKDSMYEFHHQLLNEFRLRILRNLEISGNCLNFIEWWPSAQSPCQNESFVNTRRKLMKKKIKLFKLRAISYEK